MLKLTHQKLHQLDLELFMNSVAIKIHNVFYNCFIKFLIHYIFILI